MEDLHKTIKESLVIDSYDEDPGSVDYLGSIKAIPLEMLTKQTNLVDHGWIEMFDKKDKNVGTLWFETQYVYNEPDAPKIKRD